MSIDSQHFVIAAESTVLSSQAPFQQVQDKNPWLICSAHQLNAKLLIGVSFVQGHVEAVLSLGRTIAMVVSSTPKPPLAEHS